MLTLLAFSSFPTTPPPAELSTLSLHDALPISSVEAQPFRAAKRLLKETASAPVELLHRSLGCRFARSEEHTSELQSRFDLVCRLLLEKKNIGGRVLDSRPLFMLS